MALGVAVAVVSTLAVGLNVPVVAEAASPVHSPEH